MNVTVIEYYFFSRKFEEEGKPIRGYRKPIRHIWKETQYLKVTEQRFCDQARIIRMNGWLTRLEINLIKKSMMDENPDKNDQIVDNDDNEDHGETTENQRKNFVNVLESNISLRSENVERISKAER